MKSNRPSVQGLLLVAALSCSSMALAEQSSGFYLGIGAGNAEADISSSEVNELFRDAFATQGAIFSPQAASTDTRQSSLYVFAGYRIFPWLSAEGGYINLGGFDYTSTGSVSIPGGGVQQISSHMEVESQGLAISALGNLPLGNHFEVHGRAGFFAVDTKATVNGDSAGRPVYASDSSISVSAQLGLGAAVNLSRHVSLSADWVHYFEVDNNSEDEDFNYDGFDVDVMRVSAMVRF